MGKKMMALHTLKIVSLSHEVNMVNCIFYGFTNNGFLMKTCNIFLIFAQNTDFGYTLELPYYVI